jgi:hypothetical protein
MHVRYAGGSGRTAGLGTGVSGERVPGSSLRPGPPRPAGWVAGRGPGMDVLVRVCLGLRRLDDGSYVWEEPTGPARGWFEPAVAEDER